MLEGRNVYSFAHLIPRKVLKVCLVLLALLGANPAFAENFVLDGNKALNTNNNFSKINGNPRMSVWDFSPNDPEQQFTIVQNKIGGKRLVHRSTGKCLNAYLPKNGSDVNVWGCSDSDPDQSFDINSVGNDYFQIQRRGTTLCLDNPSPRTNGGRVVLWNCDRNNSNQRFKNTGTSIPNPPQPPQPPVTSNQVILPFNRGETWFVCQGYNGPISHSGGYGLDLSIAKDFGSTACYAADGKVSRSANRQVLAPAKGKITYVNADLVCLSIDSKRSMLIGHMARTAKNGSTVNQGDVLGTTSVANKNVNGGFSHIHLEARSSSNCARGTSVPLTKANGFELINVGDLVGNQTHFKKALTRP